MDFCGNPATCQELCEAANPVAEADLHTNANSVGRKGHERTSGWGGLEGEWGV